LLRDFRNRFNNQRGITLIEVMAVIVILGILSAIAIPSVYGYVEKAKETKFLLDAVNIKAATASAYENNPSLKNLSSGSSRNQKVAEAIAAAMNTTWYEPYNQMYMVSGISIPSASMTTISVSNDGKVYMNGSYVLRTAGEAISESLGYGKLATPSEVAADPSLKNPNIFWTSNGFAVGGHQGKPAGHISILLYSF